MEDGTTADAGEARRAVVIDIAGRYLYVVNQVSHDLMQFQVAEATGTLS
jgi:6-phosphogluconolactonase (cycloisomerase 2 family)